MGIRLFVVVAAMIVALLLNLALVVVESVPEPVTASAENKIEDQFKDVRWTIATRRQNLIGFGLPEKMVQQIDDRLQEIAKRDRKGDLLATIKGAPDVAGALCSNVGDLPSRYATIGMLMTGERGSRRQVLEFDRVRNRLAYQEGYRPVDLQGLYKATELQPNAAPDAFALNVAAMLLGQEIERLEGEDDWRGGFTGPVSIIGFLNSHAEVETDMVEFFAEMHYLHEVARDPANEFCGVRAGVSTDGGE